MNFALVITSADSLDSNSILKQNTGSTIGLGGLPFGPDFPDNGGLPLTNISGITAFGSRAFRPSDERENVYQILDNVTKTVGNHSLHMGVSFQAVRVSILQPNSSHGQYTFNGTFTSSRGASFTGYGVADFLADQMQTASISNISVFRDARWYRAGYFQDDWKVTPSLTLNLGVRYDYYQPNKEDAGRQANFIPGGTITPRGGVAQFQIPGGTPDPSNPGVTCAATTRNLAHWYNPCAFANPLAGSLIPNGTRVTGLSNVLPYLGGTQNQIYAPGYERINVSLFKNFATFREQYLQFRVDAFNLLNTPAYGVPSVATDNSNGGQITAPRMFQNYTPDARFFQLSAKYSF
jgi:TonB dependent receptor